ncbi:hypothetical protein MMPV_000651 [Pyropia vietnamensis]
MALGRLARAYLIAYNAVQLCLWAYAATALATHLPTGLVAAYNSAAPVVRVAQVAAVAEIGHAATGLAGGGVGVAAIQVLGRGLVLFGVLGALPAGGGTPEGVGLLAVWAAVEVVRYPFYLASLLAGDGDSGGGGGVPAVLTWARYTAFLPLYPLGIAAEVAVYLRALPAIDATGLYRVALPNDANFAFDFGTFIRAGLPFYLIAGPVLYGHMLRQRRRKLGGRTGAVKGRTDASNR